MFINVLSHTEINIDDYYVDLAVPYYKDLFDMEEIDESDIGTYLICGCTFNGIKEEEFETSPEYVWLIIEDWGKEYLWRDYSEEDWVKMVKDFVSKHEDLEYYVMHSDAYIC